MILLLQRMPQLSSSQGVGALLTPIRERITFPAGSVEAVRPRFQKLKKLSHTDLGTVLCTRYILSVCIYWLIAKLVQYIYITGIIFCEMLM